MAKPGPDTLDSQAIRRAFDRASLRYDEVAVLQRTVRERVLQRLELVRLEPRLILDVGCGTGFATGSLAGRYPESRVCGLDLSTGMLHQAGLKTHKLPSVDLVCADAASLPLPDGSVDLLLSSLMLQWCNDLGAVLQEFRRVLAPSGLLTLSTFGPDTLRELREAWTAADGYTHVNRFIDMHDVGDALIHAGLVEPVLDVEYFTLTYASVIELMRDLKAIGAHNVTHGRPPGLTGGGRLRAVESAYERFRHHGRIPATYEVIYGQAWGPLISPGARLEGGAARIPIGQIQGRRK